jgi:hypothetical protein
MSFKFHNFSTEQGNEIKAYLDEKLDGIRRAQAEIEVKIKALSDRLTEDKREGVARAEGTPERSHNEMGGDRQASRRNPTHVERRRRSAL